MKMSEIVQEVSFSMGDYLPNDADTSQVEKAVIKAFRELKRYIKRPVLKTVPYAPRLELEKLGIITQSQILSIKPAKPRIGLTMSSIDSGNVFQVAAAVNTYSQIGNTSSINIDPIMSEMAMAQLRNTLGTDFQWVHDIDNGVVYCAHRDPRPTHCTIKYIPDYQDVSEIKGYTWNDYLIRLSEAHLKKSLGRERTKYTIEGSNVKLDGEILLDEANAELEQIRSELGSKKTNMVVLN